MAKMKEIQIKLEEEFNEVSTEAEFWKPKENDEIVGKIIKRTKNKLNGFTFFLEVGDKVIGMPNHTVLVDLLSRCMIGDTVKVKHVGTTPSNKGNDTILYKVWVKKAV